VVGGVNVPVIRNAQRVHEEWPKALRLRDGPLLECGVVADCSGASFTHLLDEPVHGRGTGAGGIWLPHDGGR